jgi:signal peptidase I
MDGLKKRKPILAFLLSLVTPGLGQIYNGQLRKGILYLVVSLLLYIGTSFLLFTFQGMVLFLIIDLGFGLFVLVDAGRAAKRLRFIRLKPFNRWYVYLIIFILGSVVAYPLLRWTIRNNIARTYRIPSSGMAPTLLLGDYLIADMRVYRSQRPQRGDVIIFEFPKDPSKDYIKRVIGIEGEKVEVIENKIYINDKIFNDPWGCITGDYSAIDTSGPVVVPKDSLFVLGDNRNNSMDSRHWGFVDIKKVKGKALYLYWAKNKSRIGMGLK